MDELTKEQLMEFLLDYYKDIKDTPLLEMLVATRIVLDYKTIKDLYLQSKGNNYECI